MIHGRGRMRGRWRSGFALISLFFAILLSSASGEGVFVDVTGDAEIDYRQWSPPSGWLKTVPQVMTGGAAVADFDNDGWCDILVTRYRDSDILYRNRGDGTFEDVSLLAGIELVASSNGVAWGDIDNDGDSDLYISVADESADPQSNLLYINEGDGTFLEQARLWGADLEVPNLHSGYSVCFGDYNRDGRLDIHTCQWAVMGPANRSVLLMNTPWQSGGFRDVTSEAGVEMWKDPESEDGAGVTSHAFTSRLTDLDGDGWPDLVVAGDYGTSRLFWNKGDGTFLEGTEQARIGGDENGMGLAVGDYDGDGLPDLFFTSIYDERPDTRFFGWGGTGNRLYRNLGGREFEDTTDAGGVRDGGWGWGAVFFDYDNDGDLDLAMTNGFETDRLRTETPFHTDPTKLWRNDGGTFTDVSVEMGITDTDKGKGILVFDYDKDGDLDLFIVNNLGFPLLYRNDLGNGNHWLRVKTRGSYSNRDGIGALVTIEPGGGNPRQYREISGGSHFLSQSEKIAHFGLGDSDAPVKLVKIRWPSGIEQEFHDVAVDQVFEVTEPETPYKAWLSEHFLPGQLGDAELTGLLADPDSDGRNNLLEYGTGSDPNDAEGSFPIQIREDSESGHFLLSYRRRNLPRGGRTVIEKSADLLNWEVVEVNEIDFLEVESGAEWGVESVTVRLLGEIPYARVRVSMDR